MLDIKEDAGGVSIKVRVQPGPLKTKWPVSWTVL